MSESVDFDFSALENSIRKVREEMEANNLAIAKATNELESLTQTQNLLTDSNSKYADSIAIAVRIGQQEIEMLNKMGSALELIAAKKQAAARNQGTIADRQTIDQPDDSAAYEKRLAEFAEAERKKKEIAITAKLAALSAERDAEIAAGKDALQAKKDQVEKEITLRLELQSLARKQAAEKDELETRNLKLALDGLDSIITKEKQAAQAANGRLQAARQSTPSLLERSGAKTGNAGTDIANAEKMASALADAKVKASELEKMVQMMLKGEINFTKQIGISAEQQKAVLGWATLLANAKTKANKEEEASYQLSQRLLVAEERRLKAQKLMADPTTSDRERQAIQRTIDAVDKLAVSSKLAGAAFKAALAGGGSAGNSDAINARIAGQAQSNAMIQAGTAHTNEHKKAQNALNTSYEAGNKQLSITGISLQTMFRLTAIQAFHTAFGALISQVREINHEYLEYEKRISEVRTINQSAQVSFEDLRHGFNRVAAETGVDSLKIAEGAYQALSNQVVKGREVMDFMSQSAITARITMSDLGSVVDVTSAILNAYHLDVAQTVDIQAKLAKAVDVGIFRLEELGPIMGRVSPLAVQLGLSFEETAAALATLTRQGIKHNEAGTLLNGVLTKLINPSKELKAELASMGYSSGEAMLGAKGLAGTLAHFNEIASKSPDKVKTITELFKGIRPGRGALALFSPEALAQAQSDLNDVQNATAGFADKQAIAFESSAATIEKYKARLKSAVEDTISKPLFDTIQKSLQEGNGIELAMQQILNLGAVVIDVFGFIIKHSPTVVAGLGAIVAGFLSFKTVKGLSAVKDFLTGLSLQSRAVVVAQQELAAATTMTNRVLATQKLAAAQAAVTLNVMAISVAAVVAAVAFLSAKYAEHQAELRGVMDKIHELGEARRIEEEDTTNTVTTELNKRKESLQKNLQEVSQAHAQMFADLNIVLTALDVNSKRVGESFGEAFDASAKRLTNTLSDLNKELTKDLNEVDRILKAIQAQKDGAAQREFKTSLDVTEREAGKNGEGTLKEQFDALALVAKLLTDERKVIVQQIKDDPKGLKAQENEKDRELNNFKLQEVTSRLTKYAAAIDAAEEAIKQEQRRKVNDLIREAGGKPIENKRDPMLATKQGEFTGKVQDMIKGNETSYIEMGKLLEAPLLESKKSLENFAEELKVTTRSIKETTTQLMKEITEGKTTKGLELTEIDLTKLDKRIAALASLKTGGTEEQQNAIAAAQAEAQKQRDDIAKALAAQTAKVRRQEQADADQVKVRESEKQQAEAVEAFSNSIARMTAKAKEVDKLGDALSGTTAASMRTGRASGGSIKTIWDREDALGNLGTDSSNVGKLFSKLQEQITQVNIESPESVTKLQESMAKASTAADAYTDKLIANEKLFNPEDFQKRLDDANDMRNVMRILRDETKNLVAQFNFASRLKNEAKSAEDAQSRLMQPGKVLLDQILAAEKELAKSFPNFTPSQADKSTMRGLQEAQDKLAKLRENNPEADTTRIQELEKRITDFKEFFQRGMIKYNEDYNKTHQDSRGTVTPFSQDGKDAAPRTVTANFYGVDMHTEGRIRNVLVGVMNETQGRRDAGMLTGSFGINA